MKKPIFLLSVWALFACLLTVSAFAADTVYLDGTTYSTLADAVAAVDDGGTVILTTSYATPTGAALTLPAKKVTITAQNGAVLTIRRALMLGGDTTFANIQIANGAASNLDFFYARGHVLTIGDGVTTTQNATTKRYLSLFAGGAANAACVDGSIVVKSGTWRGIFTGNYSGTQTGTVHVRIEGGLFVGGAVNIGSLNSGKPTAETRITVTDGIIPEIKVSENFGGTYSVMLSGGSVTKLAADATVDLTAGGCVRIGTSTGKIETHTADGYTVTVADGVYAVPFATVDGTDKTAGAFTDFAAAFAALPFGGTLTVVGDTTIGTTATGVTLAKATDKITVVGKNNAVLSIARVLTLTSAVEFRDINLRNAATAFGGNIYAQGNALTIGEGVTTSKVGNLADLALFGGAGNAVVDYDTHLSVSSGSWRAVYGGNYMGTLSGNSTVIIRNASVTGTLSAGNYTGTFSGTDSLTVDLRGGASVSAGTFKEVPTLLVDEGYEAVLNGSTYTQQKTEAAEPRTVYVDGTGKTAGAYASISAALAEMPGGGEVILCGDTDIQAATVLPKTAAVVIRAENGAMLNIGGNLTLGGDTTFRDITLNKTLSGNLYLVAAGHALTMDSGVVCLNYTASQFLSVVGGNYSSAFVGDTHITIRSGYFRNVFGGNYYGSFTGNTYVDISGGTFDNAIVGGSFNGNFTGDTHLSVGGDAAVVYSSSVQGVVGGTLGDLNNAVSFNGNTYLTLKENCSITANVFGGSRNKNVTTKGNTDVRISGNAYVYFSLYGGSYANGLNGSTYIRFDGGDVNGNVFGGSYSGTVTGNTQIEINGGKLCFYRVNGMNSMSDPAGTKNVYGGGGDGGSTVAGTATVVMRDGTVYGDLCGGGLGSKATVTGATSVTLYGGTVFGKLTDADTLAIDLSAGGTAQVGVSSALTSLCGGGKLTLAAGAPLTVGTLAGSTQFAINGLPLPIAYLTAENIEADASVPYLPQDAETLVQSGNIYKINFADAHETVEVTVNYLAGCTCRLRPGAARSGEWLTVASTTETSSTYHLAPGLYTATVVYDGKNFIRRAVYVTGRSQTQSLTLEFTETDGSGYDSKRSATHTDEILASYYDAEKLTGYKTPDTPYFATRADTVLREKFTTNEELVAFIREKKESCDYMYTYTCATTPGGYTMPLVLFTGDDVPQGATMEEAAKLVTKDKSREIFFITGGIHGNEPSGTEGALAMIAELCGDYGKILLENDKVGAVVIIPRLNPDGFYNYARETPNNVKVPNLNRDYMALTSPEIAGVAYASQLFMPTVAIDLHETAGDPVWSEGELLTDLYDFGIMYGIQFNSGLTNFQSILAGNRAAACDIGRNLAEKTRADAEMTGLRGYYYEPDRFAGFGSAYLHAAGCVSMIVEVPGYNIGSCFIERRTYAHTAALKALFAETLATDGQVAATVAAARESVAKNAQIYDGKTPIVLWHALSRNAENALTWNNPLVAADGTVRHADNLTYRFTYDTAGKYRTMPTAYVISADAAGIDSALHLLDKQGITYGRLDAGTSLSLQRYSGSTSAASLGAAETFTFSAGAYLIPVDGARAYIAALLLEPDCTDSEVNYTSMAQLGYLAVGDIYRSTESFIAAKYGVAGTYAALEIPAGKTVTAAEVDGVRYDNVHTEATRAFVRTADKEAYAVVLFFTDGTDARYTLGTLQGDVNGDGVFNIADALYTLSAVLTGEAPTGADMNGDGKVNLADVIYMLRQITR